MLSAPSSNSTPSTAVRDEGRSARGGMDCVKLPAWRSTDSSCSRASRLGRGRPPGCPRPRHHRRLRGRRRVGVQPHAGRESRSGTPRVTRQGCSLWSCVGPRWGARDDLPRWASRSCERSCSASTTAGTRWAMTDLVRSCARPSTCRHGRDITGERPASGGRRSARRGLTLFRDLNA